MPTTLAAPAQLKDATKQASGRIVQVGTKPWAYFSGFESEERARLVVDAYIKLYGYPPLFAGRPWRDDQKDFDYAIRLDP
jgi:hypothetical protein